jgi:hypothetical protein
VMEAHAGVKGAFVQGDQPGANCTITGSAKGAIRPPNQKAQRRFAMSKTLPW